MATFRIYNIQLLPLNTKKTKEVGSAGYKDLFEKFDALWVEHIKHKKILDYSFPLSNDGYISPFTSHSIEGREYSSGAFIKFNRADEVHDLYTNETIFSANDRIAAVSNIYHFRFVFDHRTHRLAVEENGTRLPSPQKFLNALEFFFRPVAEKHFEKYTLKINLVSEQQQLKQVLREAAAFSKVHVKLSFNNGPSSDSILKELKSKNVHMIEQTASAERGETMPELPDYTKALVENSTDYGEATITYFKDVSKNPQIEKLKRFIYKSKEFPKKISARQQSDEKDEDFIDRVWFKFRNMFSKYVE